MHTLHHHSNQKDSGVLLLNNKVVITHFESKTRQLFEVEDLGSFVYYKDEQKLHKLTLDSYSRLLIKLNNFLEEINT